MWDGLCVQGNLETAVSPWMSCLADSLLLPANCYFPSYCGGWRHPAQVEIIDQTKITVFATKISIYLHLSHCCTLYKVAISCMYFTLVFYRDACCSILSVFSFWWVQVAENAIPYESRKTGIFFFFKHLCQLSTLSNLTSFLGQLRFLGHSTTAPM